MMRTTTSAEMAVPKPGPARPMRAVLAISPPPEGKVSPTKAPRIKQPRTNCRPNLEPAPENLQHPAQPNGLIQRVEHDDGDGNQEGPTGQSGDGCGERWSIETVRNPRQCTHGTDDANRMPYPWDELTFGCISSFCVQRNAAEGRYALNTATSLFLTLLTVLQATQARPQSLSRGVSSGRSWC